MTPPHDDTPARRVAAVAGPTLLAVTSSETLNLGIWAQGQPTLTYLNGMLLFVAGLIVLRTWHRWTRTWAVAVTITGWLALLAGLARMFFPAAPQGGENAATYAFIGLLFSLGLWLTVHGYRRGDAEGA
ncbi:MAG: hypothetical protein H6739_39535 [Alphaproteobacteria bacterium]|nr:hypothetical protein [Alphaproteobacteria bacterium]